MSKAVLAIGHHTAHFSTQGYLRPIPMLKSSKNYLDDCVWLFRVFQQQIKTYTYQQSMCYHRSKFQVDTLKIHIFFSHNFYHTVLQ